MTIDQIQERMKLSASVTDSTILTRLDEWIENFYDNLKYVHGGYGIATLNNVAPNIPCIIVGAGRALDTNLKDLVGLEDRAIIISPDSTLKALLDYGIKPHLVFVTDSKEKILTHFDGVDMSELNIVADTFIHPKVTQLCLNAKRLYWYNIGQLDRCIWTQILERKTGFIGSVGSGGCVGTIAWWFCKEVLRCNPDILVGMSFAFYEPKSESYASAVQRTIKTEEYNNPIPDIDMYGQTCYTFPALLTFVDWFHRNFLIYKGIHINCSEMGLLKENVLNLPFSYVKETILTNVYDNLDAVLFHHEAIIDEAIKIRTDLPDLYKYRALLVMLIGGPSILNISRRMGYTEEQAQADVDYLISTGLNIVKGKTVAGDIEVAYYILKTT